MWRELKESSQETSLRLVAEASQAKNNSIDDLVRDEMKNAEATTTTTRRERPPRAKETDEKALEVVRKETAAKETKVREALKEHQERLRSEAERLGRVESELRKINAQEQQDIGILRGQLEDVDRKLHHLERDFRQKEQAYTAAKDAYEATEARKRSMHEVRSIGSVSS